MAAQPTAGGASSASSGAGRSPDERGVLKLYLHRAAGLRAADVSGTSDPYVVAVCGKTSEKSSVIKRTLNPSWEQTLILADANHPSKLSTFGAVCREGVKLKVMD